MMYLIVMSESGTWIETLVGPFKGPNHAREWSERNWPGREYCLSEPKKPEAS